MNDNNKNKRSDEYKAFLKQRREATEWGDGQAMIEVDSETGDTFHKIEKKNIKTKQSEVQGVPNPNSTPKNNISKKISMNEAKNIFDKERGINTDKEEYVDEKEVEKAFSELEKDLETEIVKIKKGEDISIPTSIPTPVPKNNENIPVQNNMGDIPVAPVVKKEEMEIPQKENKKGWLTILMIGLIGIFVVLPLFVIVFTDVLFKIIDPSEKINETKDASIKAKISGAPASIMMYVEENNYSYDGACSVVPSELNCNDAIDGYIVYDQLSDGSYYCVDGKKMTAIIISEEPELGSISCE